MPDKERAPYVLTVANLKGGAGKSTVTATIACAFHRAGVRTLIVDADSQGSLRTWAAAGENDVPPVVGLDGRNIARDLLRVGEGRELIVVDTPPRMPAEARIAMVVADLVVIPSEPGATDLWALKEMMATIEEAKGLRPNLKVYVLPNRIDQTRLSDMVRGELVELGMPLLKSKLGSRVAFREAMAAGCDVVALDPSSEASNEARALFRELSKLIKEKA
jgi:chromosome partitioning protein